MVLNQRRSPGKLWDTIDPEEPIKIVGPMLEPSTSVPPVNKLQSFLEIHMVIDFIISLSVCVCVFCACCHHFFI
jgi:hypothetical protein